jgi:hypothetical protein
LYLIEQAIADHNASYAKKMKKSLIKIETKNDLINELVDCVKIDG